MTTTQRSAILSQPDIKRRMRRMALEVAERNTEEKSLVVAGVEGNGMVVARKLIDELAQVLNIDIQLATIRLDKKNPVAATIEGDVEITGKNILVVDDVADTGRTLLFALKPFLDRMPKTIQTLVLVERSHKLFPVTSDFVGLSLSTTLQDHIQVDTEGDEISGAYLE
ncbi:phosphoribosyltransferase family protein [Paracnuella aquatica]|uniref:phosphoribosyltransferase family protein n=1 Tax=Paracnuella aquatica TaxID=2268757 RepID=UPI000DF004FF|nr:phosphoribosyltransferase family protein [Paracnuella aquatica]RPD51112.1 phosphoribosyltransferase [Paracnuella aquatica]